MTIKARMYLLAILTTACLLYILGARIAAENTAWTEKQAVITRLASAEKLSKLMHALQKERGLSIGYAMQVSPEKTDALRAQRLITDQEMLRSASETANKLEVLEGLPALRERITQQKSTAADTFSGYTLIIVEFLDQIRQLSMRGQFGGIDLGKDFGAYIHLLSAKEYLGELRGSINQIFSTKELHVQQRAVIQWQFTLYDHHLRAFLRDTTPELAQILQEIFIQSNTQTTFETMQSVIDGSLKEMPSTEAWFGMASEVIDRLLDVEHQYISYLRQKTQEAVVAAHQDFLIGILVTSCIALTLIGLAGTAIARLLHALKILVSSIKRTIETKDFTNRIQMFSRDEMSVISENFNELLSIAECLIKEKDYMASTDPLTGAYNRYKFTELFTTELQRQQRYGGTLALIMFDIDHFKKINDTFGHAAGDMVLKGLAQLVRDRIRSSDVFARWGGEEFMVLVPHDGQIAAVMLAEKMRSALEAHSFPDIPRVTASFGVSAFAPDDTLKTLSVRVDEAVYQAKHEGRNRVCVAASPDAPAPIRITDVST